MSKVVTVKEAPAGTISKNLAFISGPLVTLVDTNTSQTLNNKTITNTNVAVQTLAGVGTNAATAGVITVGSGGFVFATGGNNSVGVILPVATAGMTITVKNDDAANGIMKVYPQVNSSINSTANSAISLAANTMATFYALNAVYWLTNKTPC